jgi:hypothetical protein
MTISAHPRVAGTFTPRSPLLASEVMEFALPHLPEFDGLEIEHFFLIYKELEPGKSVRDTAWAGRVAAEAEVEASRRRLRATQEPGNG